MELNQTTIYAARDNQLSRYDKRLILKIIKKGYAKPYTKYYSTQLSIYQQLNFLAKTQKKGLYEKVNTF